MKVLKWIFAALIIFGLLIVISATVAIKYYPEKVSRYLSPEVSNIRITSSNIKDDYMYMLVKADLSSNFLPKLLDSMNYQAYLYKDVVSSGKKNFVKDNFENSSQTISLPMKIEYKSLGKKIKAHQGDSTKVGLACQAFVHIPGLGEKKFNIYKEVPFKMIVIPEIKVNRIWIGKVGLHDTRLKASLKVINPNDIDFTVNSLSYNMEIPEYISSKGKMPDKYHIKANSSSNIEMDMKTSVNKPIKATIKTIKGDKFPYDMKMNMSIKPSVKNFEQIAFSSDLKGFVDKEDLKEMK